jgi:hypothetical protein
MVRGRGHAMVPYEWVDAFAVGDVAIVTLAVPSPPPGLPPLDPPSPIPPVGRGKVGVFRVAAARPDVPGRKR